MKGREWEGDDVQKGGMWGDPAVRWWLTDQGKPGSLKTYGYKNLWGLWQWEKLPASQESSLERPTGSYNVHKPTTQESETERSNLLVGSGGSD